MTSIDQIPEDLRETISDTLASQNQSTAYNDWFDQYVEDADIQINEMPADVRVQRGHEPCGDRRRRNGG